MECKETHLSNMFRFSYNPVLENQKPLILKWIVQEHIREWLHGEGLQNTLEDLDKFFQGTSWAVHWIAYDNDTPFAYLMTSEVGNEIITLDLFICDLNYLGKGFSVQMIKEFLISQFPDKKEVIIDPEATNTRAIHVYEKVGFHIIDEFIAKWNPVPHYKMQLNMKTLMQNKP